MFLRDRLFFPLRRRFWRGPAWRAPMALLLTLLTAACARAESPVAAPPHHDDGGFRNLYVDKPDRNFFSFLRMRWFGDTPWVDPAAEAPLVPTRLWDPAAVRMPSPQHLQVSWLGHSTFLLQYRGVNILTDPVFADRASPFSFIGPRRYVRHALDYTQLPKIDYVVISHNHYDHLDETAVRLLGSQPIYLVPLRLGGWLRERGVAADRILELDWWGEAAFDDALFMATPTQHWSARGLFDRYQTLWAAWAIRIDDRMVWFAGDTGYNEVQFKETGARLGGVDLALIPIGGYQPRDFMAAHHVNPAEALYIHKDIGARRSIGMHWGTFPLTAESPLAPMRELARQKAAQGVAADAFTVMAVGETRRLP